MFLVLVLAFGALGYGVAAATSQLGATGESSLRTPVDPTPSTPSSPATPDAQPSPQSGPTPPPAVPPVDPADPVDPVTPEEPAAPAAVLSPGDSNRKVRVLQARLRQIAWYAGKVTDDYDAKTEEAVRGFQAKRGLPELGYVDAATMQRLVAMTTRPSQDDLDNKISDGTWTNAPLDPRCQTGRVMCVDKTSRTIRWVVDGEVQTTMAVRFGSSYTPTREGLFHVASKSRDHVSSLYDTPMPFAMFFSRGQAVHYSPDFAARGYNGASHGCVNVRDYEGIKALFDLVEVGDKVVVYWS